MRKFSYLATYVAVVCLAIPSMALAETTVSIDPPQMESPAAGESFPVAVVVTGVGDLVGFQMKLNYDPTAVRFESVEEGAFVNDIPNQLIPPFKIGPNNDEAAGTVEFSVAVVAQQGADGDFVLATYTFTVIEAKDSEIGFVPDGLKLSNSGAQDIGLSGEPTGMVITAAVVVENVAPVAIIEATPIEMVVDEAVSLSGAGSTDDGEIVSYAWDFGDRSDAGEGDVLEHAYAEPGDYTVTLTVTDNGDPALTGEATVIIKVTEALVPVITEHTESGKILTLAVDVLEANTSAQSFIPIWEGEMAVEAGTFMEYQVKFPLLSIHTKGGVYAHTAEGDMVGMVDDGAGGESWSHRQVSLDGLAGKTIIAITLGTNNGETPENPAGPFRMMIDNVQITDGTSILTAVWVGEESINGAPDVTDSFGDSVGVDNYIASVEDDSIAVHPKGKWMTTWGSLKAAR